MDVKISFGSIDDDFIYNQLTCKLSCMVNDKKYAKMYKIKTDKLQLVDDNLLKTFLNVRINHFKRLIKDIN